MKTGNLWQVCGVATGLVMLNGCTTQPQRVSCEQRLEPINVPAPKVAESQDKPPTLNAPAPGAAP